jgi:hypothetical protein
MGITQLTTIAVISLTSLLPASCKKTPVKKSTVVFVTNSSASVNASSLVIHKLGELALTNGVETSIFLGGGKTCFFIPKLIDHGQTQLKLTLESKNQTGKIRDLTVREVTTKNHAPFEVTLGDFDLSFTPQIVVQ